MDEEPKLSGIVKKEGTDAGRAGRSFVRGQNIIRIVRNAATEVVEQERPHEDGDTIRFSDYARELSHRLDRESLARHLHPETLREIIDGSGLNNELVEKFRALHGRKLYHFVRLLNERFDQGLEFVAAYLRHGEAFCVKHPEEWQKFNRLIDSESSDVITFWTIGPYLLAELQERGIDEITAFTMLVMWSKDGLDGNHPKSGRPSLPGLPYDLYCYEGFYLDRDPGHITHRYAAQVAGGVADFLAERSGK